MRKRPLLLFALLAIALVAIFPLFFQGIDILGQRIPQPDRGSDYMKGVIVAFALLCGLMCLPMRGADRRNLVILWMVKCFVTLVLMLFYENIYGLDAYYYFEKSQARFADFSKVDFGSGTDNLIALLWTMENEVFRTSSYHVMKVLCSFLGLLGILAFYRGITNFTGKIRPNLLLQLGLFPSILFWSSILGKDPIILFGICLSFYGVLSFIASKKVHYLAPAAFGLFVASTIRIWMVPALVLPFFIGAVLNMRNILFKLAAMGLLIGSALYSLQYSAKSIALDNTEVLAGQVNTVSRAWKTGGSATDVPELRSPAAMLAFLPIGMFTAVFRPLPGDVLNLFGLLASLENVFLLYLLFKGIRNKNPAAWKEPMAVWFIAYVTLWSMLYAFISPQNLGAAARFKLQILPPLLVLLKHLADTKRRASSGRRPSADNTDNTHPYADPLAY